MINETILILKNVNFPFDDGDVPQRPSYSVYIYLNFFASLGHLLKLVTSKDVTNHYCQAPKERLSVSLNMQVIFPNFTKSKKNMI